MDIYSRFLREFGNTRGNLKFSNSRWYFQIHEGSGNICPYSREKHEFPIYFFSSFPVLCNKKHFLLAHMSIFPRKTPISYTCFSSFPVLCNTKHFLLTMPRGNIPIARNIIDNLIKPNTAKPMKTLQLDANFWLPQKKSYFLISC